MTQRLPLAQANKLQRSCHNSDHRNADFVRERQGSAILVQMSPFKRHVTRFNETKVVRISTLNMEGKTGSPKDECQECLWMPSVISDVVIDYYNNTLAKHILQHK